FVFSYLTFIVFACFLIIIFIYDLKYYLILDKVSLPAFTIALILNVLLGYNVGNLLLASVIIGGFFGLQFIISQGKWIGGGDIRLGLVMGAMLGWPLALVALFLAYILGAVFGLILIISRRKDWQSQLPFGTFLTAATLIALLWGHEILSWYLTKL
ncbi:MAG: prepilin peptidase, partial [Candidatus Komeilibacteria bacterium CG10_big_fil_rev_8_21_14_0_10_41_13]